MTTNTARTLGQRIADLIGWTKTPSTRLHPKDRRWCARQWQRHAAIKAAFAAGWTEAEIRAEISKAKERGK